MNNDPSIRRIGGDKLAEASLSEISRLVSHALRHEPWLYELELDDDGLAPIDEVLNALAKERPEWRSIARASLIEMIESSPKRRHEVDGKRIRALYGHSLPGKLRQLPATPPTVLYHGTAPGSVPLIRNTGLLPMKRQYVHLSTDEATAAQVGRRKAKEPVILRVLADRAHASGVHFYEGNEKVWLADCVPAEYIAFGD